MESGSASWVQKPEHTNWSFKKDQPHLVKILIDLRPARERGFSAPQRPLPGDVLAERPESHENLFNRLGGRRASNLPPIHPLFNLKDENPGGQHTQFGDALSGKYFGGPILDMSLQQWQESFYTRANGDIIGANYSFPFDMNKIVRATAVMQGPGGSQSGLWVGPRLLLSTLHLQKWAQDSPTDAELQAYVDSVQLFEVESEITSVVLNNHAPKARLIDFSAKHDLGLFQLLDNYSDTVHHVTADSLIEVDEFYELHPQPGLKAACVGYSGRISESEAAQLRQVAQGVVQQRLQYSANLVPPINLDKVTKPGMKSCAPGTLDNARMKADFTVFGVSSTLWKGSSGGPCVGLEGPINGAIFGLVQGYTNVQDPWNLANGFPKGLKDAIRKRTGKINTWNYFTSSSNHGLYLSLLKAALYTNVIPRLLRPLETGGRSVKPCLIHSDLWPGNIKPRVQDDKLCIFDACTYWGHNEADLGICRDPRYRLGKPFVKEYIKHIPISEPEEDFDDRNALYALKFHVLISIMYPKEPRCRVTAMDEMKHLVGRFLHEVQELGVSAMI